MFGINILTLPRQIWCSSSLGKDAHICTDRGRSHVAVLLGERTAAGCVSLCDVQDWRVQGTPGWQVSLGACSCNCGSVLTLAAGLMHQHCMLAATQALSQCHARLYLLPSGAHRLCCFDDAMARCPCGVEIHLHERGGNVACFVMSN